MMMTLRDLIKCCTLLILLTTGVQTCSLECKCADAHATCSSIPKQRLPLSVSSVEIKSTLTYLKNDTINNLVHVHSLNVSDCSIRNMKDRIFDRMNNLSLLDLSRNKISMITNSSFGNITSLTYLDLSWNLINSIHPKAFESLIGLEYLFIGHNRIADLNFELPHSLASLDARVNRVSELPSDESGFYKARLEHLNLNRNEFRKFPLQLYYSGLLRTLDIGYRVSLRELGFAVSPWSYLDTLVLSAINVSGVITVMPHAAQHSLGQIRSLQVLSLSGYTTDSLTFLAGLNRLTSLSLIKINMTVGPLFVDIGRILSHIEPLEEIILDHSPTIVSSFLMRPPRLEHLRYLSIKNSNVLFLSSQVGGLVKKLKHLNLAENPLLCHPAAWVWLEERLKISPEFLVSPFANCNTPETLRGVPLLAFLRIQFATTTTNNPSSVGVTTTDSTMPKWQLPATEQSFIQRHAIHLLLTSVIFILILLLTALVIVVSVYLKRKKQRESIDEEPVSFSRVIYASSSY